MARSNQTMQALSSGQNSTVQKERLSYKRIAWPDDSAAGIAIDLEPLNSILKKESNKPVVILSVNGRTRLGKSFSLNQGIKYLERENTFRTTKREWIYHNLDSTGFEWSSNMESCTEGLCIWPKPFYLVDSFGKEFCLILMDNQGLAGTESRKNEEYKLWALSSLISSLFIYFSPDAVTRDYLGCLHQLCKFSLSVEYDARENQTETLYKFGNLLIRFGDYYWPEFPQKNGCAIYDSTNSKHRDKSKDMFEHCFRSNPDSEERRKAQEIVLSSFDDITIATTSPFGSRMPVSLSPPKNGQHIRPKWNKDYKQGLIKFTEFVFSPGYLSKAKKKFFGEEMKASEIVPLVQGYANRILDPNYNVKTILDLDISAADIYTKLIEDSLRIYSSKLRYYKQNTLEKEFQTFFHETEALIYNELWKDGVHKVQRKKYWNQFLEKIGSEVDQQLDDINKLRESQRLGAKIAAGGVGVVGGFTAIAGGLAVVVEASAIAAATAAVGVGLIAVPVIIFTVWGIKQRRERRAASRIQNRGRKHCADGF